MEEEVSIARRGILRSLDRLFVLLFDRVGLSIVRAFELDKAIAAAGLKIHPLVYGARASGYTFISSLAGVAVLITALLLRPGVMALIAMILAGILLPIITFTAFIAYPVVARNRRKNMIESELMFLASYLSIMARSGVPISRALEAFRKTSLFKGIRFEAQEFFRIMSLFGRDPISALETLTLYHPSQRFKDFIMGYVITLRAGGDVVRYLETRVEEFFREQEEMIRRMIQRLGIYVEVFMLISIVGGIGIFVLLASTGGIQALSAAGTQSGGLGGGFDPTPLILFSFVGFPLISAAIIYAAHIAQPTWGLEFREAIYAAILATLLSPLTYLLVILVTGGYDMFFGVYNRRTTMGQVLGLAAALLTVSIPAWLTYRRATKGLRAIERATAIYIENVSELRRTGLSPEKSFIEASKGHYGPFGQIAKRIAASIEMGIDIEEAIKRSLYGVRSWLVRAIFRLTIDSVKVGRGSPEIFYLLARYASAFSEVYERLKSGLRIYVIMPYIGAMLFVVTNIIYFSLIISQPIQTAGSVMDSSAIHRISLITNLASITNAWVMGIVAGKISGLTMGEGFKHATIITIIAAIMIWISAQLFLPP